MDVFLQNDPDNTTFINATAFRDVVQEVFVSNATPALWFYAAGVSNCNALSRHAHHVCLAHVNHSSFAHDQGSTLVCLALLSFIKQWPRGKAYFMIVDVKNIDGNQIHRQV